METQPNVTTTPSPSSSNPFLGSPLMSRFGGGKRPDLPYSDLATTQSGWSPIVVSRVDVSQFAKGFGSSLDTLPNTTPSESLLTLPTPAALRDLNRTNANQALTGQRPDVMPHPRSHQSHGNRAIMFQALQVLGVLRLLTDAQSLCPQGQIVYERIPGHRLDGFEEHTITDNVDPIILMKRCAQLCAINGNGTKSQSDSGESSDFSGKCGFFNFESGSSRGRSSTMANKWMESRCHIPVALNEDQPTVLTKDAEFDTFNEVCLNAREVIQQKCPSKVSVFTRIPGYKLVSLTSENIQVSSREECEERCLTVDTFICRSASYNTRTLTCSLNRGTRRSQQEAFLPDPDSDYLENNCLQGSSRCDGTPIFIKEERKEYLGARDLLGFEDISPEECLERCTDDSGSLPFYCQSFHYKEETKLCLLSSDSFVGHNQIDGLITSTVLSYHEELCLQEDPPLDGNNAIGGDHVTSRLSASASSPLARQLRFDESSIAEAFERYRNYVIDAEYYFSQKGYDIGRCLEECLRDESICLSAVFNPATLECRLSRFSQKDARLIYDAEFDYFENLKASNLSWASTTPSSGGHFDSHGGNWVLPGKSVKTGFDTHQVISQDIMARIPIVTNNRDAYYQNYAGAYVPPRRSHHHVQRHNSHHHQQQQPPILPQPQVHHQKGQYPTKTIRHQDVYEGNRYNNPANPPQPPSSSSVQQPYPGGSTVQRRQSRCTGGSNSDAFRQVRSRTRIRPEFVLRRETVNSLIECEEQCVRERTFICRSFNFIVGFSPTASENCELSDRDSRDVDINNPVFFDLSERHDFYQRESRNLDCIDVSQTCSEEGMEFTLRTPEDFRGRIYTYKHFDRPQCFLRGSGEKTHVLRIPGVNGYPECGTEKFGDTLTNIVVVQFSELIQTRADLRYNLTCTIRGPGSAVVTSGFIGAGSGQPTPIEYLPAEHTLDSRVRLVIMYQGRPTSTIAVGDPLEFKLETQEGENLLRDIFATNVVAKDPYSSRTVELIDRRGCPVDPYVFPSLGLSRSGDGLATNFNAFKIPESNFLVFEATVRTCRNGCPPAVCDGPQGRGDSFGKRKKRSAENPLGGAEVREAADLDRSNDINLKEMFRVLESREEIALGRGDDDFLTVGSSPATSKKQAVDHPVCLGEAHYYALVCLVVLFGLSCAILAVLARTWYKRVRKVEGKANLIDMAHHSVNPGISFSTPKFPLPLLSRHRTSNQVGNFHQSRFSNENAREHPEPNSKTANKLGRHHFSFGQPELSGASAKGNGEAQRRAFQDPSEPIYTNPSLFERSRSLKSMIPPDQTLRV